MEANLDLLPSALFSPSKAAQQRAQASEWHHVDTWLSSKYQGRSVPTFERNEDTLRALLALVAANEKADEERELLWSIQKEALSELKEGPHDDSPQSRMAIVGKLTAYLPKEGLENLDSVAGLAVAVDAPNAQPEKIAGTIMEQTQTSHTLTQHLLRLTHLQRRLETELVSLRARLAQLRSPTFQPAAQLTRQTLDWTRNTKQLRAKLGEYNDRLASLSDAGLEAQSGLIIEQIVRREGDLLDLGERVERLEARVDAFKGLPGDRDGARKEVERVGNDLGRLQRRRDELFEGLVEKG
jgi:HAUS augmin-like complex subunit 1